MMKVLTATFALATIARLYENHRQVSYELKWYEAILILSRLGNDIGHSGREPDPELDLDSTLLGAHDSALCSS